jgi:hypothetical protein
MTQILFGERELLVRAIGDAQLIVAPDEGMVKGQELRLRWAQRSLKPKPLAIMDPPEPLKGFNPIDGYFLLFTKDKLPAAWGRWAQANKITPVAKLFPSEDQMRGYLASGKAPVKFTPDAAEWYTRVVGTSPMRLDSELRKILLLGRQHVDLNELLDLIGTQEEMKAEHILKALGTRRALDLAREVPDKRSIPLMAYLDKALENRKNGWSLLLKAIRIGADRKRYSYWTGVQLFVHACYRIEHGSNQVSVALELLEAANVVK